MRLWLCAALAGGALLIFAPSVRAQGRRAFKVGSVRQVGSSSSPVSDFRNYSFGAGSAAAAGSPTGVTAGPNVYRFGTGGGGLGSLGFQGGAAAGIPSSSAAASRVLYKPLDLTFSVPRGGPGLGGAISQMTGREFINTEGMMQALAPGQLSSTEAGAPITTLAPTDNGEYARLLREGELAVRTERYQAAAERFRQAIHLAPEAPESVLSLMHTELALGNYTLAAHYLRKALMVFPELPTVQLRIRGFFRNAAEFSEIRQELRGYLDQELHPGRRDPEAQFVLAYCEWFDDNVERAVHALRAAADGSDDPFLVEAAEVFWEGCAATQKVRGSILDEPSTAEASPGPVRRGESPPS